MPEKGGSYYNTGLESTASSPGPDVSSFWDGDDGPSASSAAQGEKRGQLHGATPRLSQRQFAEKSVQMRAELRQERGKLDQLAENVDIRHW